MTPYPHQKTEHEQFGHMPRRALFWSPRIGKSFGTILSLPNLKRGLVVAPYGVCGQWARLLEAEGFEVVRLYDKLNSQAIQALGAARSAKVIAVVNYQRLPQEVRSGLSLTDVLKSWAPDAFVIDESHYIVSPSGHWARAARDLAWNIPWTRCLSGTPAPNHYGNLWGQMAALNPNEFGWAYSYFADRWLIRDTLFPSRIVAYRDLDELRTLLNKYCSFVRREDVFGPDQWLVNIRKVELPPVAAKLYARLAREWLIDETDLQVDAAHILKRLVRLQQLASGYLVADDDENPVRNIHTAKLDMVEADLGEIIATGEKAIVFHRFRWEGDQLFKRLSSKVRTLVVNGDAPSAAREEVMRAIEQDAGPIVAIVQTQSGGIGISFAEAAYALIVSQSFSFVQEEQARDRIYKPHVPRHAMYYQTQGTVDEFIAEALENKLAMHDQLTRIDKQEMAFGTYSTRHKRRLDNAPALGAYLEDTPAHT